jgi:hypothetical protein
VRALQRLGTHRRQHRQLEITQAGKEIEQELPGAAVDPLEVVEDQHQRATLGDQVQATGDALQQRASAVRAGGLVGEHLQQPPHRRGGAGGRGGHLGVEPAQRLQQRVQRGGVADVQAAAGEHHGAPLP